MPFDDCWSASLHVSEQGLWSLVNLAITASTEEYHPKVLPRMDVSSCCFLIHYPTVGSEGNLLSLIGVIGDQDPVQTLCFVELVDHIFSIILKFHLRENNGY